jgi:Protein of unknown function (DUF3099)
VPSITSARLPLKEDVGRRTHRYLVSMAIRTVCVVAAVVADGPLRWVFLAGAVFLPYIAVVLANAGRERVQAAAPYLEARAIGPGPGTGEPDAAGPPSEDGHDADRGGVDGRAA